MKNHAIYVTIAIGLMVSGCARTGIHQSHPLSFYPPKVDVDYALPVTQGADAVVISHDLQGGLDLVDNFVREYRIAASANADARQGFEVPAFVAALGAIAVTAFGGGGDGVLVGGTASAAFRSGNAYYAPKAKAAIYASALKGLFCIQQVATGSKPLEVTELQTALDGVGEDAAVFYLIKNGALSIESILRDRLSNAGSLTDVTGIAAEYEKSVKAEIAAQAAADAAKSNKSAFMSVVAADSATQRALIDVLQEKIQQCVLRART